MTAFRRPDWLLEQLPLGMSENDFFARFVRIFQRVSDTVLHQVDNLPHTFDVTVAPLPMVRAVGGWLGVDWIDPSLPDHLQRRIVREYSAGLLWRGTHAGLTRLLQLLCDADPDDIVVEDSGGVYTDDVPNTAAHVRMSVPSTGWTTEADLLRIIKSELPATVTFELRIGGRMIHPTPLLEESAAGAA